MRARGVRVLALAALLGSAACAEPDPKLESGAGDPAEEVDEIDEIVIPMQPRERADLVVVGDVEQTEEGARATFDATLDLVLADGYPTRFETTLSPPLYTFCGMLEGELEMLEVTGGTEAVAVERIEGGLAITAQAQGTADLQVRGEITLDSPSACDLAEGTTVAIDLHVAVAAVVPVGTALVRPSDCDADVPPVASSSRPGLGVVLVDASGERIDAANAQPQAQVELRLFGSFSAADGEPTSLPEWITPAAAGAVEIVPALGDRMRVDVVAPEAITAIDVDYQLAGAKGPVSLETDTTYGESGWSADHNRVAPRVQAVHIGDTRLCSAPDPAWFRLESLTPEVCEVFDWGPADTKLESWAFAGASTGQGARLLQDGACSLRLEAPEVTPGAGVPATLSATFLNVADLVGG